MNEEHYAFDERSKRVEWKTSTEIRQTRDVKTIQLGVCKGSKTQTQIKPMKKIALTLAAPVICLITTIMLLTMDNPSPGRDCPSSSHATAHQLSNPTSPQAYSITPNITHPFS